MAMPEMSVEAFNAAVDARVIAGFASWSSSSEFGIAVMNQYNIMLGEQGENGQRYREMERLRFEACARRPRLRR